MLADELLAMVVMGTTAGKILVYEVGHVRLAAP